MLHRDHFLPITQNSGKQLKYFLLNNRSYCPTRYWHHQRLGHDTSAEDRLLIETVRNKKIDGQLTV